MQLDIDVTLITPQKMRQVVYDTLASHGAVTALEADTITHDLSVKLKPYLCNIGAIPDMHIGDDDDVIQNSIHDTITEFMLLCRQYDFDSDGLASRELANKLYRNLKPYVVAA